MLRFNWKTAIVIASVVAASATFVSIPSTDAGGFPRLRPRTSVEKLAHKIDELQEDIDQLGTVVVKQPDVWGEARLTRHRAQYEKLLDAEAGNFKETIQANLRRSDQAFLLQTLALQAALSGQQAAVTALDGTRSAQRIPGEVTRTTITTREGENEETTDSTTTGSEQTKPDSAPSLSLIGTAPDLTNATITTSTVKEDAQPGIALEPTIKLDQLSRYLNHLNQLRRINEGDDTADAPGYSMNLMRFPVSVLPGTKTREGYGAEVTVTVTPRVSNKLLESTFQSLVINDLLDTLTLPILKLAELQPSIKAAQQAQTDADEAAADEAAADAKAKAAQDAADAFKATAEEIQTRADKEISELEKELTSIQQKIVAIEVEIADSKAQYSAVIQKFRNGFVDNSDFSRFVEAAKLQNYSLAPELVKQTRLKLVPVDSTLEESSLPDANPDTPPAPDETPPLENKEDKLSRLIQEAKDAADALAENQQQSRKIALQQAQLQSDLQQELTKRQLLDAELENALKKRDEATSKAERLTAEAERLAAEAERLAAEAERLAAEAERLAAEATRLAEEAKRLAEEAKRRTNDAGASIELQPITSSVRHARYPVAATQLRGVFGVEELTEIAAATSAHAEKGANGQPDYHNVRAFLSEEFDKAWKMLVREERSSGIQIWNHTCDGLANSVRRNSDDEIATGRRIFNNRLSAHLKTSDTSKLFRALGWAILVDSALLDQQLHEDMKRVAAETGGLQFTKSHSFEGLHFWGTHDNYPEGWNSSELPTPMAAFTADRDSGFPDRSCSEVASTSHLRSRSSFSNRITDQNLTVCSM